MNSFLFFHEINEQNFVFLIKFYNCVEDIMDYMEQFLFFY